MAMPLYDSPHKANNEGDLTYPRDASFSSYLDTTERDYVRSLSNSVNNKYSPSHVRGISTTSRTTSVGRNNIISRVQRNICESDVFGAERYFNEKIGDKSPFVPRKSGDDGEINRQRHYKRDVFVERKSPITPSLKSVGSFNSHIGLLLPKKGSVGHKIFSGFQCKGSCFDKKSVYTTNTHQSVRSSPKPQLQPQGDGNKHRKTRVSHQQQHFAFPIIDTAAASLHLDYPPIFGQLGKQEIELNLQRKLSILAWDAIPNSPITSPYTVRIDDEDVSSVASSDLFEIQTLSSSKESTPYKQP